MNTLPQTERALVALLLLVSMTVITTIVIGRSRCMVEVIAIMIQCGVAVLLIFGAVVPLLMAALGSRPAG